MSIEVFLAHGAHCACSVCQAFADDGGKLDVSPAAGTGAPGPQAETADNDIPGNTTSLAVLPTTGIVDATLNTLGDRDWFLLTFEPGQRTVINLFGLDHDLDNGLGAVTDTYLRVYTQDGTFLFGNDDGGPGLSSRLSLVNNGSTAVTVYIEASSFADSEVGDYRIQTETAAPSTDPLEAVRTTRTLNTADAIQVYFAQDGDVYADSQFGFLTASGLSQSQQDEFWKIFQDVMMFLDVTFEVTTNRDNADLQLATADIDDNFPGLLGFFYFPGGPGYGFLNDAFPGWPATAQKGGFLYGVAVHEFGHGFGLAHPHDTGGGTGVLQGVTSSSSRGNFGLNSSPFTQMSYNEGWADNPAGLASSQSTFGHMGTFGALDIAALQDMYGANTSHAAGDDTYALDSVNGLGTMYATIWDTGGIDAITYSGQDDATIDLRAATLNYEVGGGGFMSFVQGVIGGRTIANGVVIENAISDMGNDTLIGNSAANLLQGKDGDDIILPGLGDDTADGGAGSGDTVSYENLFGGVAPETTTQGVVLSLAKQGELQGNDQTGQELLSGFENITGSPAVDNLRGDANDNILRGLESPDALTGAGGNDTIFGGAGSDILVGGAGADVLYGGDLGPNLDRASWRSEASGVIFDFTTPFDAEGNRTSDVVKEDAVFGIEGWEGSFTQFNEFDATDQSQSYNFFGGNGGNVMYGGDGGDGEGAGLGDGLVGFNGVDSIFGNEGGDILWGRRGDDYLDAGRTADGTATDGDADQFNFERLSGSDVVVNFEVGLDFMIFRAADVDDQDGIGGITIGDLLFETVEAGGETTIADTRITFETTGTGTSAAVFTADITLFDVDRLDLQSNGLFTFL
ncbi:MAG: M10 family metallopeptidase C-terminal domain-containing protein [Pseudomonadota bacterium]